MFKVGFYRKVVVYLASYSLLMQPFWAYAGGIRPSGATNTTMDITQNGKLLVNIAGPSASGVSHNKYTDYNVPQSGAVLNNSPTSGTSQTGGYVMGNANLKGKSAGVIVNEVTSQNKSTLEGYTEVFGSSAAVVVANPNGIYCDGCGFINSPNVTLTTGVPNVSNGELLGYTVNKGRVDIGRRGLDLYGINSFKIFSRQVHIDGKVGNNPGATIDIVTGRNAIGVNKGSNGYIDYKTGKVTYLGSDGNEPQFAISSSAFGGMYGSRIQMLATDKGVGVNMQGELASHAGGINITSDGTISLNKVTSNNGAFLAQSHKGGINLRKDVNSSGKVTLRSYGDTNVLGLLLTQNGVDISSSQGLVKFAGSALSGENFIINAAKDLQVAANVNLASKGYFKVTSYGVNIADNSSIQSGYIDGSNNRNSHNFHIVSNGADVSIGSNSQILSGKDILIEARKLTNRGLLDAKSNVDFNLSGGFENRGSVQSVLQDLSIGGSLNNFGKLLSSGPFILAAAGDIVNSGTINSSKGLTLSSGNLTNSGTIYGNSSVTIAAKDVNNSNYILTDGSLNLSAKAIANSGRMSAKQNVNIEASSINQTKDGSLQSYGNLLQVKLTGALNNAGNIYGAGSLDLSSNSLSNSGNLITRSTSKIIAVQDISNAGSIYSQGALSISASNLYHSGLIGGTFEDLEQGSVNIALSGSLQAYNGTSGDIVSGSSVNIKAKAGISLDDVSAGQDLTLQAETGSVSLQGGLRSGANTRVLAFNDILVGGNTISYGNVKLTAGGDINNSGSIFSLGLLDIDAKNLTNGGSIGGQLSDTEKQGAIDIDLTGSLANAGNVISSKVIDIKAATGISSNNVLGDSDVFLQTSGLSADIILNGALQSVGSLSVISGRNIAIKAGSTISKGYAKLQAGGDISNSGNIFSLGLLDIDAKNLVNGGSIGGQLSDTEKQGVIDIDLAGSLSNAGDIISSKLIDIKAATGISSNNVLGGSNVLLQTLTNTADIVLNGALQSVGNLDVLSGRNILITAGNTISKGYAKLQAGGDINNSGNIFSLGLLDIDAKNLVNGGSIGGQLSDTEKQGAIDIDLAGSLSNGADIRSTKVIDIKAANNIASANVVGGSQVSLQATSGDITLNGALQSEADLKVVAGTNIAITAGNTISRGNAKLQAGGDITNSGAIFSLGLLDIDARNLTNGGVIGGQLSETEQQGAIDIDLTGSLSNGADIRSTKAIDIKAANNITSANVVGGSQVSLQATSGDITLNGALQSAADLKVIAGTNIAITAGNTVSRGSAKLQAGGDITNSGAIFSLGLLDIDARNLTNGGSIGGQLSDTEKQGAIDMDLAGNLSNTGDIISAGFIDINSAGLVDIAGGVSSDVKVYVKAGSGFKAVGDIISHGTTDILVRNGNVTLDGRLQSQADAIISSEFGSIWLNGESIISKADLTLKAANGDITTKAGSNTISLGLLDIDANNLYNNGNLGGAISDTEKQGVIDIDLTGKLVNNGKIIGYDTISMSLGTQLVNNGLIYSQGFYELILASGNIDNAGALQSGSGLKLWAQDGHINNKQGAKIIAAGGDVTLKSSANLVNSGDIIASRNMNITSANLINNKFVAADGTNNTMQAGNNLNITTGAITNKSNMLASVKLDVSGSSLNNTGVMQSVGNALLNIVNKVINSGKITSSQGTVTLTAGSDINNTGNIEAGSNIAVTGNSFNNSGSVFALNKLNITSNGLLTNSGLLQSKYAMNILANSHIENKTDGKILSENGLANITAGNTSNFDIKNSGIIFSNGKLTLKARDLINNHGSQIGGQISATQKQGNLDIDLTRNLLNKGYIQSEGLVDINAAELVANQATGIADSYSMINAGNLKIVADSLSNVGNLITTNGYIDIDVSSFYNNYQILAKSYIDVLSNGSLTNDTQGVLQANGNIRLANSGFDIINKGLLSNNGNINITSTESVINQGNLYSNADIYVSGRVIINSGTMGTQLLDENQAVLMETKNVTLNSASDITNAGQIYSKTRSYLQTNNGNISNGNVISSAGVVDINAQGNRGATLTNTESGRIVSGSKANIYLNDNLTNRGKIEILIRN